MPFKIQQLKGSDALLGAVLLFADTVLGIWLANATDSVERIFAGSAMVAVTGLVLYTFLRMFHLRHAPGQAATPLSGLEVAKETRPARLNAADYRPGPGGRYWIGRPPPDWTVEELDGQAWALRNQGIDHSLLEADRDPGEARILDIRSPRAITMVPVPGHTRIQRRRFLSALEVRIAARLSIVPVPRIQPPLFVPRSAEQNILAAVGEHLRVGVFSLVDFKQEPGGEGRRARWTFGFRQEIRDAVVDGRPDQEATCHVTIYGVEGDLEDYLLLLNYPGEETAREHHLEQDLETLRRLAESFEPMPLPNPKERTRALNDEADRQMEAFLQEAGPALFEAEFGVAVARIAHLDLDRAADRAAALRALLPFERFAQLVGDAAVPPAFWEACHAAEAGDARAFKEMLAALRDSALDSGSVQMPAGTLAPAKREEA